ncbi:5-carboxymethyl-2-hydroxymuconate Delta-isomerase [Boseaceae bacterium BT-24-1]|nr:5-carboxymethyl-2-hydroxymuconate Delta-isomerase [Boseaceae bacterium BT-24-1]
MPHIIIEATTSAADLVPPETLTSAMHDVACGVDGYPLPGVRTRLHLTRHFRIADGDPAGAFVHVNIRIGVGFDQEARSKAALAIADRLSELFEPFVATKPIALSVEVTEIDTAVRINRSNVRELLAKRAAST